MSGRSYQYSVSSGAVSTIIRDGQKKSEFVRDRHGSQVQSGEVSCTVALTLRTIIESSQRQSGALFCFFYNRQKKSGSESGVCQVLG